MLKIQKKLIISSGPEYDAFCLWNVNFDCITYFCQLTKTICRGTQGEILRKRPKNNNRAWIKLSEAILSILGDCWENIYLFLTPSKTGGRVPSQQGAPTTCNRLTYQEVSQKLLASLGVVIGQNSALSLGKAVKGGGGGGGGGGATIRNWVGTEVSDK